MTIGRTHLAFIAAAAAAWTGSARGQLNAPEPPERTRVEVVERLGERVPLDVALKDWTGATVRLSKYFESGKPVVLVLGYYDCPMVCPLILERLYASLNAVDFTVGRDFNVVYVSFDPDNTTSQAEAHHREAVETYRPRGGDPAVDAGWAFHTSDAGAARRLADAVGFRYRYVPESGEYSHSVVLVFLSGEGVISRYIYGFDYDPRDVKLSLMEASKGAISRSLGDRLLWFCFHYDASTGRYSLAAFRVMQAGAVVTLLAVGSLVAGLRLGERARRRRREGRGAGRPVAGGIVMAGHGA